jgi:hypothetical protein
LRPLRACLVLVLLSGLAACARPSPGDGDSKSAFDDKTWEDQRASLPPFPKTENLALIDVGPTGFDFLVDTASISVDIDGTIRYTLIARSSSGAMNVSYESIRCEIYQRRLYALGRSDGTWSQARNSKWVGISGTRYATFGGFFFCDPRGRARAAADVVDLLKRSRGLPR